MSYLQFQDFNTPNDESFNSPFTDTNSQKGYQKPISSHISSGNLGSDVTTIESKKAHFLSFQFYQQYFDVDTKQVQTRILNSIFPKRNSNFLSDFIQPTPDLYGPFWICVTLIFSTAICGNFMRYVNKEPSSTYESDFSLVTGSTSLITSYVLLVPFAIYSVLWYRKSLIQYSYMELLCAYGYSLSIFIPVPILWINQINWFRWLIIISTVVLSGTVLVNSLWPAIKGDTNRLVAFSFLVGVGLMHALLAICLKEFYFDTSMPAQRTSPIVQNEEKLTSMGQLLAKPEKNFNTHETPLILPVADAQLVANVSASLQKAEKKEVGIRKNVGESPKMSTETILLSSTPTSISADKRADDSKKNKMDFKKVS